ncbi:uncharacterized protein LOC122083059 [Macadamia integrifolia]|uniref:uncharacterized protein LOC122083059 n=1 Tax=Macadamia integrifolia TaxID=60698 RepID=UPI001C4EE5DF|nr:uncharacterized protein LOC122083059 [Macadamia integrifolia]
MAHSLVCQLPSDQERRSKETMIFNSLNLNIYSSPSKTDQIMSRYRPIAPKPQLSTHHHPILDSTSTPPQKPQRPLPFLRNLSPHLQTRSYRGCRKRTKVGFSPCNSKRSTTTTLLEFSSSSLHAAASSSSSSSPLAANTLLNLSMRQGFTRVLPKPTTRSANLATLPLLPHPSPAAHAGALTRSLPATNYFSQFDDSDEKALDLNSPTSEFPREEDHPLQKLHAPPQLSCKVIAPQPLRPIGSSISVGWISENPSSISTYTSCAMPTRAPKRPEEVEEEVESEVLPAVISDSNNKVRLANSAYKEMVGQPECSWLDATYDARVSGGACKRIGGEVTLQLPDAAAVPPASNGFSCKVKIEWGSDGKKGFIYAPCDVIRLACVSKDYLFTWRFHTRGRKASEADSNA